MSRAYDFTGLNGDNLPSLLQALTGDYQIQNNKLIAVGAVPAGGHYLFTTRYTNQQLLELSDATNEVVVNCAGSVTAQVGLVVRLADVNNYLAIYVNATSGEIILAKMEAATLTTLASANIPSFDVDSDYVLTVVTAGDNVKVSVDGDLLIDHTTAFNETAITAGGYFNESGPTIDNLVVATPINTAPTVDAGSDLSGIVAGSIVALTGTASDVDNDELTYLWEQLSGPTVTISNPTMLVTSFTAPSQESSSNLQFQLTVDDGQTTGSDTVNFTVSALVPDAGPELDELQRELVVETGEQALKRVGKSNVVTSGSIYGDAPVHSVVYPSDDWKRQQRYSATQQNPEDENGLGYQFEDTDRTEV